MALVFESTAVKSISDLENNQVTVTFQNGREYLYNVSNSSTFMEDLNLVIEQKESVGRFINQAIKSDVLTLV